MQAEIITIGDEILIGQILDTNSAWIASQLNDIGIHVRQLTSVADHKADIQEALSLAMGRADVILVTGGLGPTQDDVTKQAFCDFFGCSLVRDESVLAHVIGVFENLNRPMLEVNRKQADVLDIADVLFNDLGTAPGMWIEWQGKYFAIMPGVPFEMKHIMVQRVIPRLQQMDGRGSIWHHTMLTGGMGESFLAEKIADIEASLPEHIHLAYLPKPGTVRLRLTATGKDLPILQTETQAIQAQIQARIGKHFLAGEDTSLPALVFERLDRQGLRLTTAESCTGGDIARLVTSLPGSSRVFVGGAVAYSNELKTAMLGVAPETLAEYGAVSEQTVREMATGAQTNFGADYAVAVSGIAGPGGGTPKKPVGLVWVAVAGRTETVAKKFQFGGNRLVNIERASAAALLTLLFLIQKEEGMSKSTRSKNDKRHS